MDVAVWDAPVCTVFTENAVCVLAGRYPVSAL
jgi:hypothetical protein